ncbi:WD40 repeat-like protein [Cyathus striatus]|nr:WD40 repeat-like protein [Cyathus striatus]
MSFKNIALYPPNPNSARGVSTKLATSKDKLVYATGKAIIIRDLKVKGLYWTCQNTTVARFSPSGYYCASADVTGTVKVWDTVGEDQIVKGDYKVVSGRINDLCWDGESKRIIAVGDGRDKFGHAFMMDTGASTGDIIGHSKPLNAVSIRQQRPFKAATAGDDNTIIFHTGMFIIKTHKKFVQDVQYAPSGDNFASVGSDFKLFVYDGKTGDVKTDITDSPHKGSIMACAWSTDSKSIATASADCTVKLWDAEAQKAVNTWTVGAGVNYQQVGATWSGEQDIVSLSLFGTLNIFDSRIADKPSRIFNAPQKAVNAIAQVSSDTFLAGCADGRVLSYSTEESTLLQGETHSNYVSGLATSPTDGKIYSIGYDDKVREIEAGGQSFVPASVSTSSQPKAITVASDSTVFVVEQGIIEGFRSNQKVLEHKPKYVPSAIATTGNLVAVGGEDQKVHLNEWNGKELKEVGVLEANGGISAASFSPDGKYLVVGDTTGRLVLYDPKEKTTVTSRWSFHSARVNSLTWTPDSQHIASGSLDSYIYIWSIKRLMKNIPIKLAHPGGVNGVLWKEDGKTLVSSGADGCIRTWEISFHPPA